MLYNAEVHITSISCYQGSRYGLCGITCVWACCRCSLVMRPSHMNPEGPWHALHWRGHPIWNHHRHKRWIGVLHRGLPLHGGLALSRGACLLLMLLLLLLRPPLLHCCIWTRDLQSSMSIANLQAMSCNTRLKVLEIVVMQHSLAGRCV